MNKKDSFKFSNTKMPAQLHPRKPSPRGSDSHGSRAITHRRAWSPLFSENLKNDKAISFAPANVYVRHAIFSLLLPTKTIFGKNKQILTDDNVVVIDSTGARRGASQAHSRRARNIAADRNKENSVLNLRTCLTCRGTSAGAYMAKNRYK